MEQKYRAVIIAEMGSCHDGDLAAACELIRIAKEAGANIVKGQFWSDSKKLALRRHASELSDMYEKYKMPKEWLPELKNTCNEAGVEFLCTCYLPEDIAIVAPWVKRFKVSSFEALDWDFLNAHLEYQKPLLVSTGLLDEVELRRLLFYRDQVKHEATVQLLHCVSAYPCPVAQANLSVIPLYGLDGFSDHTGMAMMGAMAYLAGGTLLEVHFRSDLTKPDNPDYPHSLSPLHLKAYVDNVRYAEQAFGDCLGKVVQIAEQGNRKYRVDR